MDLKHLSSQASARRRLVLRLCGLAVLIAGLSSAASIWVAQDRLDRQANAAGTSGSEALSPEDSRRYTHDVQLYYGETGLLVEKWKRWFGEMTQGRPLAYTVGVASLVVAGALFSRAADRKPPPAAPSPP